MKYPGQITEFIRIGGKSGIFRQTFPFVEEVEEVVSKNTL